MSDLLTAHCKPYPKDSPNLTENEIIKYLKDIPGWRETQSKKSIYRDFKFNDYYETIAFINSVAEIVHQQDHHPELNVTYNCCHIEFTTHSVNGLSLNDFICAAKINHIENN